MKKILLATILLFLAANSSTLANEKPKLPDYEKWHRVRYEPERSHFSTFRNGCSEKNVERINTLEKLEELSEIDRIELDEITVRVGYDKYRYPNPNHVFLNVIKDINGKPWLILYSKDDTIYLFKRQRHFKIFGYRWEFLDTYEHIDNEEYKASTNRIFVFQLKHCLFFPTQ